MGANPSVNSPSLRSLIRFEVVKGVVVLLMSVALPKIVDWLTSLDNKDPVPPAQLPIPPSTFAPWKDRTEAMYALFLPAMQTGGFVGILLSRLYRIDMANFRRQHPEADLRRDTLPGYLLVTESEAKSKLGAADDAEEGLEPHSVAIRVLSIPEAIRTNTIQQLLCPPWYFAAGYLTMLLLLVFALPTFVRYSPMVMVLREESFKLQGVAFDDSAWLTPNLSIAMYGAVHLLLLPLPMLLAVAVLSFLRGESDFVWNHQAEWKPFSIEDTVEAAEDTGADEKIVAGMLINDGYKEEETLI
ncbi:hypothetical protein QFC19_005813 [Naganishia cerealis]|uniref:Uncharacterized protein n=1 Tax=Naganishia cerealis TaxID=610337 RepID=A0ACC2VLL6_9TREE|nr:hypothetical protein QFC19_005813 [Naganishia cerealis]